MSRLSRNGRDVIPAAQVVHLAVGVIALIAAFTWASASLF